MNSRGVLMTCFHTIRIRGLTMYRIDPSFLHISQVPKKRSSAWPQNCAEWASRIHVCDHTWACPTSRVQMVRASLETDGNIVCPKICRVATVIQISLCFCWGFDGRWIQIQRLNRWVDPGAQNDQNWWEPLFKQPTQNILLHHAGHMPGKDASTGAVT